MLPQIMGLMFTDLSPRLNLSISRDVILKLYLSTNLPQPRAPFLLVSRGFKKNTIFSLRASQLSPYDKCVNKLLHHHFTLITYQFRCQHLRIVHSIQNLPKILAHISRGYVPTALFVSKNLKNLKFSVLVRF